MSNSGNSKTATPHPPDRHFGEDAVSLEREIRKRHNPEEVAARLAGAQYAVRREAYATLCDLALRLTDAPEILERLLESMRSQWNLVYFVLARGCLEKGEAELALRFYAQGCEASLGHYGHASTLCKIAELGTILGRHDCAAEAEDQLFDLITRGNENAVNECRGLAYAHARNGFEENAGRLWQRLLAACPENHKLKRSFLRFRCRNLSPVTDASNDPGTRKRQERHDARSGIVVHSGNPSAIVDECATALSARTDDETLVYWINIARFLAEKRGDTPTANLIWNNILLHAPTCASAYLRFSKQFNVLGRNPQADHLIRHAQDLSRENAKPRNNGKKIRLKNGGSVSKERLDDIVTVDGVPKLAGWWLTQAGQCVSRKETATAFRIWIAVLRHSQQVMPAVTRGLVRIVREFPAEQVLKELRIPETIQNLSCAAHLYQSLAANVAQSHPAVARQIMHALVAAQTQNAGSRLMLAEFLIRDQEYGAAKELWLPLDKHDANACANCAALLAEHGQHALAKELFAAVAPLAPAALIRYGYRHFREPNMGDAVLECIESILPMGDERHVEEHQVLALKLLMHHGIRHEQTHALIRSLTRSGALSTQAAERILSTPLVIRSRRAQAQRDAELEEYLLRHMPDLRKNTFFRQLEEHQPLLKKPGKRTDRTARSVLLHPHRSDVPVTHGPVPRRKKK